MKNALTVLRNDAIYVCLGELILLKAQRQSFRFIARIDPLV